MHLLQSFCLPPALQRALVHLNPPTPGGVRQPGRAWWVLAVGAWLVLLGTVAPALAQSTDATLSGLTVSPAAITGFDSAKTEYAVGVANDVTQATVTPTANASITIDGTTVTSGSGHQVTLVDGSNVVSIVVTAADSSTETYTVTINRESTDPYGWKVLDDFNHPILADLNRQYFRDITSDGETLWVASPASTAKVYAFNMETKARDTDKDIAVASLTTGANSNPWGLWTDDQTMWVADHDHPRAVFAYTLDSNSWTRDFDLATGNSDPTGMWSDGQTLWVANEQRNAATDVPKIFAYTLSNGQPDKDLDFNTLETADNTRPKGIWSDGEIMWVADSLDKKLYAYDMLTQERVPAKDFSPKDMDKFDHGVWGIWSDGQTMWVENPNETSGFIRSYVMPQSDSTRLRLVSIDGKEIDLAQTNPTHYVANTKTQVTVEAKALHFKARVTTITPTDADDTDDGHQVALSGDNTTITITVTAQDGTTTPNHTVTVTKIEPPGKPTGLALTAAHKSLTVTWDAPTGASGITAYDVRYRRTNPTDSEWKTKKDIWQSGSLSYKITRLDNDQEYEVQVRAVINGVPGEWSGPAPATGTPEAASNNADLRTLSVIIDGTEQITFDAAITSYTVNVAHDVTQQATISATVDHEDASIDGDASLQMNVNLDVGGNKITITVTAADSTPKTYTVIINRASTAPYGWKVLTDIDLSETTAPRGIWSGGTTLWVADDDDDNLEAYDLATGDRKEDRDIDLDSLNNDPGDIWSDGEIMWVAEFDPPKVYAYDLATGARKEDRDIDDLDPDQLTAWDIWSDGETIWVNPHGGGKLYAYDPATGDRKAGKDITLSSAGDQGMWSDGETLWVVGTGTLVPYLLFSLQQTIPAGDSRDLAAENDNPWGVWSDAETLYVADDEDDKVYTYNVPKSDNAELKSLSLSPVDMDIDFNAATTEYDIDVAATVSQVTVDAKPFQRWATIAITPADADTSAEGHQVNLSGTSTDITITVTAHDGTPSSDTYTVTVNREASDDPPSSDATLSRLTLSAGRLNPTFVSGTTTYTAAVGYTVEQLTVTPTATDTGASITIGSTTVASGSGQPVDLNEGTNTITITVTAEDTTTKPYTVTVTRTAADLSLTPSDADPEAAYDSTAVYTVTFKGEWTTAVTPDRVPGDAHFSRLIGAVHNDQVTFLESGELASAGIESMAEFGRVKTLKSEIKAAKPNALDDLEGDTDFIGPEVPKTLTATLTTDHPRVTLTTMIAPSHDWFVGVSGLPLLDAAGRWRESHTVDLFPWDAGTEEGNNFSLTPNVETDPQGVITSLRGTGPFTTERIATLSFTLQSVSTNADLSAIQVNDTAIAGFDPATFSYIVGVPSTTTQATLSATPVDTDATVAYSVNGTDVTGNPQVTFTTTDNSFDITITVTAADGVTTGDEYTVTVRRGVSTEPGWKVDDDIDLSANSAPRGVWSNGTTLWAADATEGKLFAYTLDGVRVSSKDIPLDGANTNPTGVWSDGVTLWVADATAGTLFAYTLATRSYDADKNIELATANTNPTDIWSDGTTLWVADATDRKLYAYTLPDGSGGSSRDLRATVGKSGRLPRLTEVEYDDTKDIDLDSANADPTGLWSDGETIWVADADARAYAYSLADGSRDSTKDIDLGEAGNDAPHGVWSDGETLWVADSDDTKLFSYTLPVSNNAELRGILVDGEAASGSGTSYTRTVANNVAQVTVEPQPLQSKATATVTTPPDADTGAAGHQVNLGAGDNSVTITVTAQDDSTTKDYTLTITRTNSAPVFPNSTTFRDFPENTGPDVNISPPIEEATDNDSNVVIYSLDVDSPDADSFNFNTETRQLTTKQGVVYDYEMPVDANTDNDYEVTVTATDNLAPPATIEVTITVTPVNEPAAFSDTATTRSVPENTGPDTNIGTPVTATDPDTGDTLTYSLGGPDVSSFDIDATNGQLLTKQAVVYDYEATKNSYEVVVLATDGNQAVAATIEVTITVTDEPEPGAVSLSSDSPQALTPLTATLNDEDASAAQLRAAVWQWASSNNSTDSWTVIAGQTADSYTPQAGDVGKYLRATATYSDRLSPPNRNVQTVSAQVQTAPVVVLVLDPATIDEAGGISTLTARLTGGTSDLETVVMLTKSDEVFTLSEPTLTIPANMTESESSVTLTAVNNHVDHDASRTVEVTGLTPNPQVTGPDPVQLTITDDDTRGVTLSPDALTVIEGDTTGKTYTVKLDSKPTAQVTVEVVLPADTDVRVSPQRLTFTTTNWDDEQMVTVTAAHDTGDGDEDDMATITHTVTSSSGDYDGLSAGAVTVTVEDDEAESTAVELTVSPEAVDEDENPTTVQVTVTGTLNGKPLEENIDVTLMVTGGTDDGMATAGEDFTAANVRTLTIPADSPTGTATFELTLIDDDIHEPNETVTVGGTTDLTALPDGVTGTELTIEDNEALPTVMLHLLDEDLSISENGGETEVTARLSHPSSEPTMVKVSSKPGDGATEDDFTQLREMVTIEAGRTEKSEHVVIMAENNEEDEADKTVEVSGEVTTQNTAADPPMVELTITDDDPPELKGPDRPPYVEGNAEPVATYTATNPDNITITWSLDGADADKFTLIDGVLRFKEPPDFEDPANPDKEYVLTVTASDETLPSEPLPSEPFSVTVAVIDAPGALCLSSFALSCRPLAAPRIGQEVHAILEDLDVDANRLATDLIWVWEWALDKKAPDNQWESLCDPGASPNCEHTASYTPDAGDVHRFLRVTATYTDGDGTGPGIKAPAQVISDEPVTAVPDDSPRPPPGPSGRPPGGGPPGGGPPSGGPPVEERPDPVGYLENPGPDSFQSGIGLISGWVCEAESVEIEIETAGGEVKRLEAAYGTERLDTARRADGTPLCGDTDNGFGLLFNWNRLDDGAHTVVAWVDEVELGRATVTVTTLGEEFLRDAEGACVAEDFPLPGETVTLAWQQNKQNFVITSGTRPAGENRAGIAGVGYLENPGADSFQSGIGVISGWVCEAEGVEIEIETESGETERQVAAYGTERLDTETVCGDTDNGFGLLFNWNRLGEGEHEVVAYVDGVELGRAVVRVTTVGAGAEEEFLRGAEGECVVADFPMPGETVLLEWQQNSQNFVITDAG